MIDVRLDTLPARHLLAIAHYGDYMGIGAAFGRLYEVAIAHGLLSPETVSLGIYYSDTESVPADQLRSHACLTVPPTFTTPPDGCELLDLPGGEFALGIHRGPYRDLHASYRWLFGQWLPASGREPADQPVHEIYVNSPRDVPEMDLITHICLPLMPVTQPATR
jgi:AraC family transcriptional regulator